MTSAVSNDAAPGASKPAAATVPSRDVTAEGEAFASDPRRLRYIEVATPASGASIQVAPGVRWARIPLPLDLNHINVWLLDVADGCIAVDTGIAASMGKEAWEALAQAVFADRPLRAVFVTHIHPDHIGLAAWLQQRHGVAVLMSKRTHELANIMIGGEGASGFGDAESFFRSHGLDAFAEIEPLFRPGRFARMTSGLPQVERHVADGEAMPWDAAGWTAMQTDGHAEGHLCLYNAAARVLISGDQVLPTISSNISFTFRSGDMNPLGSYLSSLRRLRALPPETLVLPSHGVPFRGLQQRIDDLLCHHEDQLALLERMCTEPRAAAGVLSSMFRRELKGMHLFLALGEALAHLEYLVHAGRLQRRMAGGVVRYVR